MHDVLVVFFLCRVGIKERELRKPKTGITLLFSDRDVEKMGFAIINLLERFKEVLNEQI
jgi:hypothetical protein